MGSGQVRERLAMKLYALLMLAVTAVAWNQDRRRQFAELHAHQVVKELQQGDFAEADRFIGKVLDYSEDPYYLSLQGLVDGRVGFADLDIEHIDNFRPNPQQEVMLKRALTAYTTAIDKNPDDDVLWHNRAWLELVVGAPRDAAVRDFEKAVSIDGSVAVYHYSLAYAYGLEGRRTAQIDQYIRAIENEPDILDSTMAEQIRIADPTLWETMLNQAVADLKNAEGSAPNVQVDARLASIYISRGMYDQALPILASVTTRFPQYPVAWRNLARVYLAQQRTNDAAAALRRAIALDGADCRAWIEMSAVARARHNDSRADQLLVRAGRTCRRHVTNRASRMRRVYTTTAIVSDDILPPGLSSYLETPALLRRQRRSDSLPPDPEDEAI